MISLHSIPKLNAKGTPFLIQQFADDVNDWIQVPIFGGVENNQYVTNCTRDFRVPNIAGVSYISDGKTLKGTIWLREPLPDPSLNLKTKLTIEMINATRLLLQNLSDPHFYLKDNKIVPINVTDGYIHTTTSGREYGIYNYTSNDGAIAIIENEFPTFYVASFNTAPTSFGSFWPKVKAMLESLDISEQSGNTTLDGYLLYNNTLLGINMLYPDDWQYLLTKGPSTIIKFAPQPYWLDIQFGITLQTVSSPSYGETHSDYKSYIHWNFQQDRWERSVDQLAVLPASLAGAKHLKHEIIKKPDFNNTSNQQGSHVDLFFNLTSINSPSNFHVISDLISRSLVDNELCHLRDVTNWVPLPPPKIFAYVRPDSLSLRPGEEKDVTVFVNSSANLPLSISFNSSSNDFVNYTFSPDNLNLSSYGRGSSTLTIKASDRYIENGTRDFALPIDGHVSFPPQVISVATGVSTNSSLEKIMTTKSFLQITMSNPLNITEQFKSIISPIQTSLKEIEGLVITVSSIVGSLGLFLGWIIKRNLNKKSQ